MSDKEEQAFNQKQLQLQQAFSRAEQQVLALQAQLARKQIIVKDMQGKRLPYLWIRYWMPGIPIR